MRKRDLDRLLDLVERLTLKPEPDAAVIVREVMLGFKGVMNPDLTPPDNPPDIYATAMPANPDPAWDLADAAVYPDAYLESQERELLEDHG